MRALIIHLHLSLEPPPSSLPLVISYTFIFRSIVCFLSSHHTLSLHLCCSPPKKKMDKVSKILEKLNPKIMPDPHKITYRDLYKYNSLDMIKIRQTYKNYKGSIFYIGNPSKSASTPSATAPPPHTPHAAQWSTA